MDQKTEIIFKDVLKRERALRGWSQADVAEKIGSDPKTVGRWERGLTSPSPYLTQQLCVLYGKTVQELGLVKNEIVLPVQDKAEPENNPEVAISIQEISSAPDPIPADQKHELTSRIPHSITQRITQKRRPILLSSLLVFTLLIAGSRWLFPSIISQTQPAQPYSHNGPSVLALNDSLKANTAASWSLSNNDEGHCFFADGSYHVSGIKTGGYMKLCLAAETYFSNFTYEVKMQVMLGDCGGLAFRATFPQLYYFLICQDGKYRFVRYDRDHTANRRILVTGVSSVIHKGFNSTNILAVVATGNSFTLYINHTLLYHGTDEAYFDGQIGLLAHTCSIIYLDPRPDVCAVPVEVTFRDATVWKN